MPFASEKPTEENKGTYWSDEKVRAYLSTCPEKIYALSRRQIELEIEQKSLEHDLRVAKAEAQMKASAGKESNGLTNTDDRKAFVETQPEVMKLTGDLIRKEGEVAVAKIDTAKWENTFTAARKIASMIIAGEEAMLNDAKYRTDQAKQSHNSER